MVVKETSSNVIFYIFQSTRGKMAQPTRSPPTPYPPVDPKQPKVGFVWNCEAPAFVPTSNDTASIPRWDGEGRRDEKPIPPWVPPHKRRHYPFPASGSFTSSLEKPASLDDESRSFVPVTRTSSDSSGGETVLVASSKEGSSDEGGGEISGI